MGVKQAFLVTPPPLREYFTLIQLDFKVYIYNNNGYI